MNRTHLALFSPLSLNDFPTFTGDALAGPRQLELIRATQGTDLCYALSGEDDADPAADLAKVTRGQASAPAVVAAVPAKMSEEERKARNQRIESLYFHE